MGGFTGITAWRRPDPSRARLEHALKLYHRHDDKTWSLTDCLSFVVMRERRISEALTGDHHFAQAGFGAVFE